MVTLLFLQSHKSNIANRLKSIFKTLDKLNSTYENLALLGDFNAESEEESISEFLNLKNLVKQSTCCKNPNKPTCIDLILANCPRSFQNTDTFETGLSDFHKLTFTVLKQHNLPDCFGQACSNKEKICTSESCQFCDKTVKKGYNEKIKIA